MSAVHALQIGLHTDIKLKDFFPFFVCGRLKAIVYSREETGLMKKYSQLAVDTCNISMEGFWWRT